MLLDDKMTELADAIRSKTGKTGKLSIPQMVSALTPSGNIVYWDGNLPKDYHTYSLAKPIPAHTKISDIIITSDKPDESFAIFLIHFKHQDENITADVYYMNDRWNINILKRVDDSYIAETELPDDMVEILAGSTINNLKIVVKGADSGIPTYTTVFQAYTGLANAIKKSTSTSGKLTIEKNLQISTFGGSSYDFTSPVPSGDTILEVTLQVVNSGTGSVTISIPGTSISKTIATGERGYHNLTLTLDIPSGMANSIKAIEVDVGRRNALKQLTVVAK